MSIGDNCMFGDRVKATMDGETWFTGTYVERVDLFAGFGVLCDCTNTVKFFTYIESHGMQYLLDSLNKKDERIKKLETALTIAKEGFIKIKRNANNGRKTWHDCGREATDVAEQTLKKIEDTEPLSQTVEKLRKIKLDCNSVDELLTERKG